MQYRADIDGLRALAVLAVVIYHAFPSLIPGGFIGVDIFFVISGYLITHIIFNHMEAGRFSFSDFFARRVRRIFPALVLVMATCLVAGWFILFPDEYRQLGKHAAGGAAFIANFVLWNEAGYFDASAETKPLLHLWSLSVEEQFYIIWPLVLLWTYKRARSLFKITLGVAIFSFILSAGFAEGEPEAVFYWPISRFWELLCGSMLAWVSVYRPALLDALRLRAANLCAWAGIALYIAGLAIIEPSFNFPGAWALLPVTGGVLMIAAGPDACFNRIVLRNPLIIWIGLISYPLYLWHWPLLSFLQIIEGETPTAGLRIVAVISSFVLAWATYRFIELPIRNRSLSLRINTRLAGGLLTCLAGGMLVYNLQGFEQRVDPAYGKIQQAMGEWGYPDGLRENYVDGIGFYSTSDKAPEVLLVGDSHIEQYAPRVKYLDAEGQAVPVGFMTSSGCPPIPGIEEAKHPECKTLTQRLDKLLETQPQIHTLVLGGAFNIYLLGGDSDKYDYRIRTPDGRNLPLNKEEGARAALDAFIDYARQKQAKRKVVVLLDNPHGPEFAPRTAIFAGREDFSRPLPVSSMQIETEQSFALNREQKALEERMQTRLQAAGIKSITQSAKICKAGVCDPLDNKGRPKYRDGDHMRPLFVREHMDVLDFILRPQQHNAALE